MFKKILVVLIAFLLAFAGFISTQPDDFRITRSAVIAAPAEAVFAHVNNLHAWEAWSPWAKLDPNATSTFEGAKSGVNAKMHWDGNAEVGKGSMTIIENRPGEFIKFQLDFLKPMEGHHTAEFLFKKQEDGSTEVSWTMYGKNNFIGKAMGLVMDCDTLIGEQFEKGLASLKDVAEKQAAAAVPVVAE